LTRQRLDILIYIPVGISNEEITVIMNIGAIQASMFILTVIYSLLLPIYIMTR